MSTENSQKNILVTSVVVAAVVLAGAFMYQPSERAAAPVAITPATDPAGNVVLGNPDAPVTIIIFGDYECPYCERAFSDAEAKIRDSYVADGRVKMVFRDFPLNFHASATPAAEAAQCAGAQGKYWEYHDELFKRQADLGTLDYAALAGELGLDRASFATCVSERTFKDEVQMDLAAGQALGVSGTPASFINGRLVSGAYPFEEYQKVIEGELKKAERGW